MTDRDGLTAIIATLDIAVAVVDHRMRQNFVITYGLNSRCRSYEEKSEIHERNIETETKKSRDLSFCRFGSSWEYRA